MIDVRQHILPAVCVDRLREKGVRLLGGAKFPNWDFARHLEMLEQQKIKCALRSVSSPGVFFGD